MSMYSESAFPRVIAILLALASGAPASAQIERQHGAHVHGTSIVDIALDGKALSIHLDAPGINLLGFEHAPRDAAERASVATVRKDLEAPSAWLQPNAAAACRLTRANVETKGLGEDAPAGAGSAGTGAPASADAHADLDADYMFDCAQPELLGDIDIRLAARYAGTKTVTVNIASPAGQTRTELSGAATRASFPH